MARSALMSLVLLVLAPLVAVAQAPSLGSTLRVRGACPTAPDCPTVLGTLRQHSPDSLVIREPDGVEHHLRVGPATTVDYPHGTRRYTLEGLGLGAVAGLVVGSISQANCTGYCGYEVTGGLLLGSGVGALVGAIIRTTRWERVPPAALAVRRVGDRSVVALGVEF